MSLLIFFFKMVVLPSRIRETDIGYVNLDGKRRSYGVWAVVPIATTELALLFHSFFCLSKAKSLSRQLADRPVPFTEGEMGWQLGSGIMMFGAWKCLLLPEGKRVSLKRMGALLSLHPED